MGGVSRARFYVRCRHCGLAHSIDDPICEVTGNELRAQKGVSRERGSTPGGTLNPVLRSKRAAVTDEYIGRILGGRYRPLRLIGQGGSSAVYECEDMKGETRIALKLPHRSYIARQVSLRRFYQEASVIREIDHPNICAVLDIGQLENGTPFLAMELLKGETLEHRLTRLGRMGFAETCLLGMHVLEPLVFTHRIGVVHQDIKPGNIFLCRDSVVKLLDFGLSRKLFTENTGVTPPGDIVGTPLYIAPEQLARRRVDHRVDVYAVGVVLLECLFGFPPFQSGTVAELLKEVQSTGPMPAHVGRPDIPASLAAAIEHAVHKNPGSRYESAADMYAVLEMLFRGFGGSINEGSARLARTLPAPPLDASPGSSSSASHRLAGLLKRS
jgi:serine/threonine-protein kinase